MKEYITGFFDADGYITMVKTNKTDTYKTIIVGFTNNDLNVLKKIQEFLLEHKITTSISTKKPKKSNHHTAYDLKTSSNQNSLSLCRLLEPIHARKKHRIGTVLKYHNAVTKRNGQYSEKEKLRRLAYERLFFFFNFH